MVPFPFGLHVLGRVYRRRRVHRRRNFNSRNLTKLTRLVRKRQVTQSLMDFTQMILESTFAARELAQEDEDFTRSFASADRVMPIVMEWHRRLQRETRELEASLFRMKEKYSGCSVEVFSTEQMEAVEYLHGIGWTGNIRNPTENRVIAASIAHIRSNPV
ncbi:hypothetical protein AAG906_016971 [Vitis piasezkii]